MKHNILTYTFLAAFCAAAPLSAAVTKDAAAVKAEAAKKKAEAEAKKKAEAAAKARMAEARKTFDTLYHKKAPYEQRIAELLKLLDRPEMKNDPAVRYFVYIKVIQFSGNPPWTHIGYYDYNSIHKYLPVYTKLIMDDPQFSENNKFSAGVEKLVQYYCDYEKWDEAEKCARAAIANEKLTPDFKAKAWLQLAKIYRYQYRYEDAMNAAKEACKHHMNSGVVYASNLAIEYRKPEDAAQIWKEYANEYAELIYYAEKGKSKHIDRALAFVKDEKNPADKRYDVILKYFTGDMSEKSQAGRKLGAGLAAKSKASGFWAMKPLKLAFQLGDYPLTVDLCEFYAGSPIMADYNNQCVHVIALGGIGKKAEAAKLAAEFAKNEKLKPVQKTRFLAYEALLTGKDPDAVIKGAKLSRKDEAVIYLSLARQTLSVWHMQDLAEKYTKKYETYFAKPQERRLEVKFSDTPVKNISDWRKIYPTLEKQFCDIPFKGSMDFLETDVSTGDRGIVKAEDGAKLESMMEVSAVCDVDGVHLFLRTRDTQARAIQQGFARGIGTEMYFAPGRNQPYICIGSDAAKGVTFMFQTTYNNKNAKRPHMQNNPVTGFRSEVAFTDTDYVLHMFFAWDLYYNKLPSAGTDWRFDCLAWSKAGGFSWGGSQGIHSASAWGDLRFNLTEKQLNAIRKGIIFRSYRNYKMIHQEPGASENLFEIWKDSAIGDPAFYNKMLAPLEAELDGYAKRVKFDMTDAEVAEIYTKALPRWKGLTHEVDELRRRYLSERITTMGK